MFSMMDGPLPAAERARIKASSSPKQDVVLGVWESVLNSTEAELDATVDALAGGIRVPYLRTSTIDSRSRSMTAADDRSMSWAMNFWPRSFDGSSVPPITTAYVNR